MAKINTKLNGSLIGYKIGNALRRATVVTRLIQDDLLIVQNEADGKRQLIDQSQVKWING